MTGEQRRILKWLLKNGTGSAKWVGQNVAPHVARHDDWARTRLNAMLKQRWVKKMNPASRSDPVVWSASPEGRAALKATR